MELGNAIFGNSRGEVPVPRGEWQEEFARLNRGLDRLCGEYIPHFENDVFVMRPYYWGDCTCGSEEKIYEWEKSNEHDGECYQRGWNSLCERYGSWLKVPEREKRALCAEHGIPWNDGYGCAVHCTCYYDNAWEKFAGENDHTPDCPVILPNFVHKPTGYELQWYKYPLRDSYASRDVTFDEFREMIDACLASLK